MADGKFSRPRSPKQEADMTQVFTPITETEDLLNTIDAQPDLPPTRETTVIPSPVEEFSIPDSVFEPDPQPERYDDTSEEEDVPQKSSHRGKIIAISLCSVALGVLICIIAALSIFMSSGEDDGLILNNVTAAGVNIGGMTREEAAAALHRATDLTFTIEDMVIQMPDKTICLSPADTGAKLDIDALIEDAYNYGRTGTKQEQEEARRKALYSNHTIALLPYLGLDQDYIRQVLDDYGSTFNSTFTQSSFQIQGDKPILTGEDLDPNADCQALIVYVGTPGRHLVIEKVFNDVLDAYSFNTFLVEAKESAPQEDPKPVDLDKIFKEHCSEPVDAVMDKKTYVVTAETYGYTFDLDRAKELLAEAKPGSSIGIPFEMVKPAVVSGDLSNLMYRDVLGSFETPTTSDENRNNNLRLACAAINGMVLEPGDTFDYNKALGERTEEAGYKAAGAYANGQTVSELGGGICQVSSTLYYCTLIADLEIVTRSPHSYVSGYMPMGMDAAVSWGGPEFRFRNNTNYPIRIEAAVEGDQVQIRLLGTDEKDYYIKMEYEVIGTKYPVTVYEEYPSDNPKGYWDGQVIQTAYTGYVVKTFKCKYDKQTDELISRDFVVTSNYNKRDQVIVKIVDGQTTEPTAPTDPSNEDAETDTPTVPPTEPTTPPETQPPAEDSEDVTT